MLVIPLGVHIVPNTGAAFRCVFLLLGRCFIDKCLIFWRRSGENDGAADRRESGGVNNADVARRLPADDKVVPKNDDVHNSQRRKTVALVARLAQQLCRRIDDWHRHPV